MRLLRYADLAATSWKNGGGVTREIISKQRDDASSAFLWRISIATVAQSGPFSPFPGIDRTIAVLAGNGMRLHSHQAKVDLTTETPPYRFSGETPISATVLDGPTIDLNVMTLHGAFKHDMHQLTVPMHQPLRTSAQASLVVFTGDADIQHGSASFTAGAFDALVDLPPGTELSIASKSPGFAYLIGIDPQD